MSRTVFEQNLGRLEEELRVYVSRHGVDHSDPVRCSAAQNLGDKMFLAHSTSTANFVQMCEASSCLLSTAELNRRGIKTLKANAVERVLKTSEFVFLFANAFSFPSSGCGLLFARSLETDHPDRGSATPFDSGGLVHYFKRPDIAETPLAFFHRHQMPLPEHRNYLAQCLAVLYADPFDYVRGNGPFHAGPIGLTGGDPCRRSTHEVRIPEQIAIRGCHLQAVFAPLNMSLQPQVQNLLKWCESEGFDFVTFDSDRNNDFDRLKEACIAYMIAKLN